MYCNTAYMFYNKKQERPIFESAKGIGDAQGSCAASCSQSTPFRVSDMYLLIHWIVYAPPQLCFPAWQYVVSISRARPYFPVCMHKKKGGGGRRSGSRD